KNRGRATAILKRTFKSNGQACPFDQAAGLLSGLSALTQEGNELVESTDGRLLGGELAFRRGASRKESGGAFEKLSKGVESLVFRRDLRKLRVEVEIRRKA